MRSLFRKNENEHVGEPIDYFKEYKIKIFRAVPPNVALICKNIFSDLNLTVADIIIERN